MGLLDPYDTNAVASTVIDAFSYIIISRQGCAYPQLWLGGGAICPGVYAKKRRAVYH